MPFFPSLASFCLGVRGGEERRVNSIGELYEECNKEREPSLFYHLLLVILLPQESDFQFCSLHWMFYKDTFPYEEACSLLAWLMSGWVVLPHSEVQYTTKVLVSVCLRASFFSFSFICTKKYILSYHSVLLPSCQLLQNLRARKEELFIKSLQTSIVIQVREILICDC